MSDFQSKTSQSQTSAFGRRALWTGVGLLGAFLLTFLCMVAFAALLYFGNVSEKWAVPAVTVISLVSLFFAARFSARRSGGRFWTGASVGAVYYFVLHLISVLMGGPGFSVRAILLLVIGALTGGIGVNLGNTTPEKKKKRKRKK